jgi:transposase
VSGPGAYVPDPTEGITRPENLPKAKVVRRSRNFKHERCPRCGKRCPRDRVFTRVLHDVGDLVSARPRDLHLVYSQHHCTRCRRYFTADTSDYALPKSRYTHRVVSLAVRLVVEDGLPYQTASWHLWRDHRVFVPFATIQNWVEAGGKKGGPANVDDVPRLGPG